MIRKLSLGMIISGMAVTAILTLSGCEAQKSSATTATDNAELKKMVDEDQKIRQTDTIETEPIDKIHRERVLTLLAEGLIKTNEDKWNAALILQHTALTFCNNELKSISPENYLLAFHLARSAFESGLKNAAYLTAATYDRYLLYTQGYQKYGTQRVIDERTNQEIWAPIDPHTTDDERTKYTVPPLKELLKQYPMKPLPASK